jgi:hypothetical protein
MRHDATQWFDRCPDGQPLRWICGGRRRILGLHERQKHRSRRTAVREHKAYNMKHQSTAPYRIPLPESGDRSPT